MNWLDILIVILKGALLIATGLAGGMKLGQRRAFKRIALSPEDETIVSHSGAIEGDALRFTVWNAKGAARVFRVPREMAYHLSDDLMRAAAKMGKREEPQRGVES